LLLQTRAVEDFQEVINAIKTDYGFAIHRIGDQSRQFVGNAAARIILLFHRKKLLPLSAGSYII
jgi:hypothetical protein